MNIAPRRSWTMRGSGIARRIIFERIDPLYRPKPGHRGDSAMRIHPSSPRRSVSGSDSRLNRVR